MLDVEHAQLAGRGQLKPQAERQVAWRLVEDDQMLVTKSEASCAVSEVRLCVMDVLGEKPPAGLTIRVVEV